MAVHEFEGLPIAAQVAVRGLDPQQILQSAAHVFGVWADLMGMAAGQKGQQGQAGNARVGLASGVLAVASLDAQFPAGAVLVGVPAAVVGLIIGQPVQGNLDGLFAFRSCAVLLGHSGAIGHYAELIKIGQRTSARAAHAVDARIAAAWIIFRPATP